MPSLFRILIRLPGAFRAARRSERRVRKATERFGAGLAPLEHRLDDIVEFFDWFEERMRISKIHAIVSVLRDSQRYDTFHSFVIDIESRRERLDRLSTTFTPLQRSKYRGIISALAGFHRRLTAFDDILSWTVRSPQLISRRLSKSFSVRSRSHGVAYLFDPSGAMLFGDGMDSRLESMFDVGPRRFKREIRSYINEAFSLPEARGVLEGLPQKARIRIASVSGSHSSLTSRSEVVVSINVLEFFDAFEREPRAFLELLGAPSKVRDAAPRAEHHVLISVKEHAVTALLDVWRKRALSHEYAGVLSVERLELPSHTGPFDSADEFIRYADLRVAEEFSSYLARDIGLHIGWILFCDRMGHYRPIGTAAIHELAGRKSANAVFLKIISEIRSVSARELINRYVHACKRLTRAPLIDDPQVL